MKRVEQLMRKVLDGRLAEGEAEELVGLLRASPARAHEMLEHQRVLEALSALPRPDPPADFTARTLQRVSARHPPRPSPWTWLLEPRATVRLGLAQLAGALAIAALAALGTVHLFSPGTAPVAVASETLVRFVYQDPGARSVSVAGDFNGWSTTTLPMRRLAGGAWEALAPVPRGRHQYMFVVDGEKWIADPAAPQIEDEFGGSNGVLEL